MIEHNPRSNAMKTSAVATITTVCLAWITSIANGAQIIEMQTKADTTVDWADTLSVNQFNDMGGTRILTGISVQLKGNLLADQKYENRDGAGTITLTTDATVTGSGPGIGPLDIDLQVMNIDQSGNFDNVVDFDGPSGESFLGQTRSDTLGPFAIANVDWGSYIGGGLVDFAFNATGKTSATGPGDIVQDFVTAAGAMVIVTYDYRARMTNGPSATPEPSTFGMMAVALLAGLGLSSRASRRRRK
jgi:hypothetical protein